MTTYQMPLFDQANGPREETGQSALVLNSTVDPVDAPRLSKALSRLLEYMQDKEWHSATEITDVAGRRYGARLHELAMAGYPHGKERVSGGEWRYRLL